jgi:hypothetical protein
MVTTICDHEGNDVYEIRQLVYPKGLMIRSVVTGRAFSIDENMLVEFADRIGLGTEYGQGLSLKDLELKKVGP